MRSLQSLFLVSVLAGLARAAPTNSSGPPPPALNGSLTHDWLISIGPRNPTIKGYDPNYAGFIAIIDQQDGGKTNYTANQTYYPFLDQCNMTGPLLHANFSGWLDAKPCNYPQNDSMTTWEFSFAEDADYNNYWSLHWFRTVEYGGNAYKRSGTLGPISAQNWMTDGFGNVQGANITGFGQAYSVPADGPDVEMAGWTGGFTSYLIKTPSR